MIFIIRQNQWSNTMSGKIGKYVYKNERVLKEFLGGLLKRLGGRKASGTVKKLMQDPEVKKYVKSTKAYAKKTADRRKKDPEYDKFLKSMGL